MNLMKNWQVVLLLAGWLAMGCTDGKKVPAAEPDFDEEEELAEEPAPDYLPRGAEDLFDDFMYNFATNERLQLRRIDFPLSVESDDQVEQVDTTGWDIDSFFLDEGEYTLIFDTPEQMELVNDTSVSMAVVEKIFLTSDSVRQYVFRRDNGRWSLTGVRLQSVAENANAAFLSFYRQFAADSLFRQQSLADEIQFSGPDPDDDFGQMEGFITPDSWDAFAPELPRDSIYNIVYKTAQADTVVKLSPEALKIFVIRGLENGMDLELTFQQERGRWKLTKLTE